MNSTHTKRLELLPAPVRFIELLIAGDYQQAGQLLNVCVPHGWPQNEEAQAGLHIHLQAMQADRQELLWRIRLIVLRESREVIGSINLKGPPKGNGDVEIGWGVVVEQRGHGFAVEAARAVIEWVFSQGKASRVIATIAEDNKASTKVAERLGMSLTEEKKRDLPVWAIRREYLSSP